MSLYVIAILVLSIIAAHILNLKKIEDRDYRYVLQSTLEGFFGFLFIYFFFLQGYITVFVILSILVVLMIGTGLILFMRESQFDTWDLVIETSKNVILLFLKLVLPLMFFFTVFRFQVWYLQILFTLLSLFGLVFVLNFFKFLLQKPIEKITLQFSMSTFQMLVTLWLMFGLFFLLIWTFNFPVQRLEYNMNLANSTPFLHFDGYETKLLNQYKDEELFRLEPGTIKHQVDDYYLDGNDLYLYNGSINKDSIIYINIETGYRKNFSYEDDTIIVPSSSLTNANPLDTYFTKVEDGVILTGDIGVYHISGETISKMIAYQDGNHEAFYMNDQLYVLEHFNSTEYTLYTYSNKTLTVDQAITITDTNYPDARLNVYNKELYFQETDRLIRYDETMSYDITNAELPFDINDGYLYSTVHDLLYTETIYYKIGDEVETFTYDKYHNNVPLVGDDVIFYLDLTGTGKMLNEYRRVDIHNKDLTANSVVYHTENKPFHRDNNWIYKYIVDYKVDGNDLYYLQLEYNNDDSLITYHKVSKSETFGIPFTFYSHYGIGVSIFIIAAVFIPITNYKDHITIISFENALKRRRK